ncbi:MAG: DUF1003 domain-containing protein [bacterium]|nr:DUF1003 domain-containing protein [bacterium]
MTTNTNTTKCVSNALRDAKRELAEIQNEVKKNLEAQETIAQNVNIEFDRRLTFGEKLADRVAAFGGSWKFIILFGSILCVWIIINSIVLFTRPFDPFPFILLNLVLSSIAALQAPVIMMSQNRQAAKDRMQAEHDYNVNVKAELEIRNLHGKMDFLIERQWQRLLEIQQIQIDLLEGMSNRSKTPR